MAPPSCRMSFPAAVPDRHQSGDEMFGLGAQSKDQFRTSSMIEARNSPERGATRGLAGWENCRRAVAAVGVGWFHRGATARRTPRPAYLARNKSWPKWSRTPSVPSSWSKWAGSPQVPILQYFQIHRSYQNAWSFSISRFTGHTRMLGPSVFPDSRVLRMLGPLMPKV